MTELFNKLAEDSGAQQRNASPGIRRRNSPVPDRQQSPNARAAEPSSPLIQRHNSSPTKLGPVVPRLRLSTDDDDKKTNIQTIQTPPPPSKDRSTSAGVRFTTILQLSSSRRSFHRTEDSASEISLPLETEETPRTPKGLRPVPRDNNSPTNQRKPPVIRSVSVNALPTLKKDTPSRMDTVGDKVHSDSPRGTADKPAVKDGLSGYLVDRKCLQIVQSKLIPSASEILPCEKEILDEITLFCRVQADALLRDHPDLLDEQAGDDINAYTAMSILGMLRPNLTLLCYRLERIKSEIENFIKAQCKTTKKLQKILQIIFELLTAKGKFENFLRVLEIELKNNEENVKQVFRIVFMNDQEELHFIQALREFSSIGHFILKSVYSEMRLLAIEFRKMTNYTMVWEEPAQAACPMRNIRRQEIVRCHIPHQVPFLSFNIKGIRNGEPFNQELNKRGPWKIRRDRHRLSKSLLHVSDVPSSPRRNSSGGRSGKICNTID